MKKFLAAFFLVAVSGYAQDPMDLVRRAYALQQSGDYAAAADAYRAFLKIKPDEVGAHSNLGVVLTKLGRYDEAISEYQAAEKLAPGDPRIGLNLALAYEKSGRVTDAQRKLQELHAISPQEPQITMLLADCDLRLGENNKVIELLQPVEAQNPGDLATAYMLGTALIREKRVAEGQRLVNVILQNGDTSESRFLLGSQMFASGDFPNAVKQFASAIALNPNVPELQAYYGQSLLFTGDPDGAASAFRKELANDPNNFAANLGLAQILTERKQYPEAAELANKAVLLRPASVEALLALGECRMATGDYKAARQPLEKAESLDPQSAAAHRDLASLYGSLHLASAAAGERREADELRGAPRDVGPKPNDMAPDFTLPEVNSNATVRLAAFRGSKPVVLIFGSYTCPNFRSAAPALDRLFDRYGDSVAFLLVYIREAHGSTGWQSTRNERDNVKLDDASNMSEKAQHATLCTRKLHLKFPAVVDGMDGKTEQAYSAWPSRAFVIGKDGHIRYTTRLTELDFHANEMEAAVRRAAGAGNQAGLAAPHVK